MNKSVVIIGAGSIGRGFISELMQLSGFDITLVDVDTELIKNLQIDNSYTLDLISKKALKQRKSA